MLVSEKFVQSNEALKDCLNDLDLKIKRSWVTIIPTPEQMSKTEGLWRNETFTMEAYEELKEKLIANGFILVHDFPDTKYKNYVFGIEDHPMQLYFKVELSNADECAKLKARLAELGCHY